MGASYDVPRSWSNSERVIDAFSLADGNREQSSWPARSVTSTRGGALAMSRLQKATPEETLPESGLSRVQDRADIDISGPEFNFVRSIRVFNVRYARQSESESTGDCTRSELVVLGTYGIQGDFAWQRSSTSALPAAHSGLERFGKRCPEVSHRSVFVEWRDYKGRYGFEQINY